MQFKTFTRPDLLTYFLATIVLIATWPYRSHAIDIQLHDSYYVIGYASIFSPVIVLLSAMGFIYTAIIRSGRMPSKSLSWFFIAFTAISLTGIVTRFPNTTPS